MTHRGDLQEDDRRARLSLDIGSVCAVYSRSSNKWFETRIVEIFVNSQTNEEWFVVKYGNNKQKRIQRFCADLYPKELHMHKTQHNQMMSADLGIFDKDENECVPSDYTKCDAMRRLLTSSKYNSMLKTKKSEDYDEILIRFMNEVYNEKGKGLIDDYIHFQEHHEHELERT
eukprot:22363_1